MSALSLIAVMCHVGSLAYNCHNCNTFEVDPHSIQYNKHSPNPPIGSMAAKLLKWRDKNPLVLVQLPLYTQQHKKKIKITIIIYHLTKVEHCFKYILFQVRIFRRKCLSHVSKWFSVQPYLHQTNRSLSCNSCWYTSLL